MTHCVSYRTRLVDKHLLLFLFLLAVIVSLLSGAYPALVLSAFKPISVLKNVAKIRIKSSPLKRRRQGSFPVGV